MARDILILRDPKESWKKCSLAPLRGMEGVRFVTWREGLELEVTGRLLLDPDAPEIGEGDVGRPLFLIDSSWRRLAVLRRAVVGEPVARSLPRLATAYPRRSETFPDPEVGLASIEALFAASCLAGTPDLDLLAHYHFRDAFLAANRSLRAH
ncbi:MAG: hypothetical protein R3F34_16565 [Planctomycetota bacterium]